MILVHKKIAILVCIILLILSFSCTPYVLKKRVNKQNGYILYAKEHIFFVPCNKFDTTTYGFVSNLKKYGFWFIGAKYSNDEMDSVRAHLRHIAVRLFYKDAVIDTIGVAPAYVEYRLYERAPKRIHDGGNYNCVFFIGHSMVSFKYYEAYYNVISLKRSK